MRRSFLLLILILIALLRPLIGHAQNLQCRHPFVFFDLGMTIVDTATHNYNPMFLMPGAREYMQALKQNGYSMGAISDVPLAWGRDTAEVEIIKDLLTAKWLRMLYFMQGRYPADKTSWMGPPLDVSAFGTFRGQGPNLFFDGRVLLPLSEHEQKKIGSLEMFWKARMIAARSGCRAIFQGEDIKEVTLARRAGMAAFWVGHDAGPAPQNFYLPIQLIDRWGL